MSSTNVKNLIYQKEKKRRHTQGATKGSTMMEENNSTLSTRKFPSKKKEKISNIKVYIRDLRVDNTRFTPSLKFYVFSLSQSAKFFSLAWAKSDKCKVLYFCVIFSKSHKNILLCIYHFLPMPS